MSVALQELLDGRRGKSRGSGCFVCGGATEARVMVQIREAVRGKPVNSGVARNRTHSFCAEHAVALWERLIEELEKK